MERYSLKAEAREGTGKGVARKLREKGLVPGVIYGKKREAQSLILDPSDLKNKMGGNAIFDLAITGGDGDSTETAMIKEVQKDVISGQLKHIDFQHISMDEKITVSVLVNLIGDAPGVDEGGVLQQLLREIDIECLPLDIPEEIEVDISNLDIGNSISVSEVEVGDEIDIVTPADEVIVTLAFPAEEEEEEELEDEFMEPEVIGEETADDEEETEEE
ncbi:50S ribosomal protein L25 [Natronospora cellulosivora (SeqCode)]